MAWEKRHGRLYYYRKQRGPDGRVRSIYLGRGEQAIAASLEDGVPLPDDVAHAGVTNIRHVKKEADSPVVQTKDEHSGARPAVDVGRDESRREQPPPGRFRPSGASSSPWYAFYPGMQTKR